MRSAYETKKKRLIHPMDMNIVFLGTAGAIPTKERNHPAVYVEYCGERVLFDCGEGAQRQMMIANVPFMKLDRVFITHLHADHILGLAGLIQTMDLFKRAKPLQIFGPVGIHDVIKKVMTTGHFILEGFDLEVDEVRAKKFKQIFANDLYSVKAVYVDHNVPCLAYSFEEAERRAFLKPKALKLGVPEGPMFGMLQRGETVTVKGRKIRPDDVLGPPKPVRKIAYVTDTRPSLRAVELARGADLLIHEATFTSELAENAVAGRHSTAKEAAGVAKKAGAKKLYMIHVSQRYPDAGELEKEARAVFKNSYVARDFDRVVIKRK